MTIEQGTVCPGSGQYPDTNSRVGTESAYCSSCGGLKTVLDMLAAFCPIQYTDSIGRWFS